MIIDAHTHIYPEKIADRAIAKLEAASGIRAKTNGRDNGLLQSMREAGVRYSLLLPVATSPRQVDTINEEAAETNVRAAETGFLSFGGIHPDTPDYKEVLRRVKSLGLKGIKLHPDYQKVFFNDIRCKRIVEEASGLGLYIMIHAGVDIGLPDPVHCRPDHVIEVLRETGSDKLILAHMGGWRLWDEVKEKLSDQPVYLDTAFSLDCMPDVEGMLTKDRFVDMVRSFGAEKIAFGTDSPWCSQKACVEWIRKTALTEQEKEQIFSGTIRKILDIA